MTITTHLLHVALFLWITIPRYLPISKPCSPHTMTCNTLSVSFNLSLPLLPFPFYMCTYMYAEPQRVHWISQSLCTTMTTLQVKIIKNEVGCRDDTVPKTGDTRRHCEVELTVCNNLPQPPKKPDVGRGFAEDCCMLSTLPRSAFLCHLFLARCHPYILLHFYTCLTNFFRTAQGHVATYYS